LTLYPGRGYSAPQLQLRMQHIRFVFDMTGRSEHTTIHVWSTTVSASKPKEFPRIADGVHESKDRTRIIAPVGSVMSSPNKTMTSGAKHMHISMCGPVPVSLRHPSASHDRPFILIQSAKDLQSSHRCTLPPEQSLSTQSNKPSSCPTPMLLPAALSRAPRK
jgi:hypothetical protein